MKTPTKTSKIVLGHRPMLSLGLSLGWETAVGDDPPALVVSFLFLHWRIPIGKKEKES